MDEKTGERTMENLINGKSISRWLFPKADRGALERGVLSSHQKNEISPRATTGMELGGVRLSQASRSEKDRCHMISLSVEVKIQDR